jgi:transposase-like protein
MFTFVEQWRQSGETQRSWCDMHGMHHAKFQYWVRKYREAHADRAPDHAADFVDLIPPSGQAVTTLEVHFPSGAIVKLPASELDLVRQLVR